MKEGIEHKEITPGECRQDYRLAERRRGHPRRSRVRIPPRVSVKLNVLPHLVAEPPKPGRMPKGLQRNGITCGVQAPTLQAAIGVAGVPMVSFPLSPRP